MARAAWHACLLELQALKPGNVGLHGDGHGMTAAEFVLSARCAAEALALPGLGVGARIRACVVRTRAAVGCNTNLGIVLLCAPIAQAALTRAPGETLRARLDAVLAALDRADAQAAFEAIRIAAPGGLGRSARHDVSEPAAAGLREVMAAASHRDRIALQYEAGFGDVFDRGVPLFEASALEYGCARWAAVRVYLEFLAAFADTHVLRKHGAAAAEAVRREAQALRGGLLRAARPEEMRAPLLAADAAFKARGINPGTSADLTVATLFASRVSQPCGARPSSLASDRHAGLREQVGIARQRCSPEVVHSIPKEGVDNGKNNERESG